MSKDKNPPKETKGVQNAEEGLSSSDMDILSKYMPSGGSAVRDVAPESRSMLDEATSTSRSMMSELGIEAPEPTDFSQFAPSPEEQSQESVRVVAEPDGRDVAGTVITTDSEGNETRTFERFPGITDPNMINFLLDVESEEEAQRKAQSEEILQSMIRFERRGSPAQQARRRIVDLERSLQTEADPEKRKIKERQIETLRDLEGSLVAGVQDVGTLEAAEEGMRKPALALRGFAEGGSLFLLKPAFRALEEATGGQVVAQDTNEAVIEGASSLLGGVLANIKFLIPMLSQGLSSVTTLTPAVQNLLKGSTVPKEALPAIRETLKNKEALKTLLILRGGSAGITATTGEIANAVNSKAFGDKFSRREAASNIGQSIMGSLIAAVPELMIAPGATNAISQVVTDLVFDATTDAVWRKRLTKENWRNWLAQEIPMLISSSAFATKDYFDQPGLLKTQQQVAEDIKKTKEDILGTLNARANAIKGDPDVEAYKELRAMQSTYYTSKKQEIIESRLSDEDVGRLNQTDDGALFSRERNEKLSELPDGPKIEYKSREEVREDAAKTFGAVPEKIGDAEGFYDRENNRIVISDDLKGSDQLETIIHEKWHSLFSEDNRAEAVDILSRVDEAITRGLSDFEIEAQLGIRPETVAHMRAYREDNEISQRAMEEEAWVAEKSLIEYGQKLPLAIQGVADPSEVTRSLVDAPEGREVRGAKESTGQEPSQVQKDARGVEGDEPTRQPKEKRKVVTDRQANRSSIRDDIIDEIIEVRVLSDDPKIKGDLRTARSDLEKMSDRQLLAEQDRLEIPRTESLLSPVAKESSESQAFNQAREEGLNPGTKKFERRVQELLDTEFGLPFEQARKSRGGSGKKAPRQDSRKVPAVGTPSRPIDPPEPTKAELTKAVKETTGEPEKRARVAESIPGEPTGKPVDASEPAKVESMQKDRQKSSDDSWAKKPDYESPENMRGFVKDQVLEDPNVDERVKRAILERDVNYTPQSNNVTLETADALIGLWGIDSAVRKVRSKDPGMSSRVINTIGMRLTKILADQEKVARESGDKATADKLVEQLADTVEGTAIRLTENAQGLQVANMFARMSPEGSLRWFQNDARKGAEKKSDLRKRQVSDVKSKMDDIADRAMDKVLESLEEKGGTSSQTKQQINKIVNDEKRDIRLSRKNAKPKAIKEAAEKKGVRISEVVKDSIGKRKKFGQELVDDLISKANLTEEEAKALRKALMDEYNSIVKKEADKVFKQILVERKERPKKRSLIDELRRITGATVDNDGRTSISEQEISDAFSKKLGDVGRLSDELARDILDTMRMVQDTEKFPDNSFQEHEVVFNLMKRVRSELKKAGIVDAGFAIMYGNMLSGFSTFELNLVSTFMNSQAELIGLSWAHRGQSPHIWTNYYRGLARGFKEAVSYFKTGIPPQRVDSKYSIDIGSDNLDFKGRLRLINVYQYVTRSVIAGDAMLYTGLENARYAAMVSARMREELTGGKRRLNKDEKKKIREQVAIELGTGKDQRVAAEAQAKAEGLKPKTETFKRRVEQLLVSKAHEQYGEETHNFAAKGTFNYKTDGVLGSVVDAIHKFSKDLELKSENDVGFVLAKIMQKSVVPFTRVVANVSNATIRMTPIGWSRLFLGEMSKKNTKGDPVLEERRRIEVARNFLGTTGMAIVLILDELGLIEVTATGPSDFNQRNQLRETGWKPHSIRIGDAWVSYLPTPFLIPFAMIGHYKDAQRYGNFADEDTLLDAVAMSMLRTGESIFDSTFLAGLDDFMGVMSGSGGTIDQKKKKVQKLFARSAANFIPGNANLLRQIEDIFFTSQIPQAKSGLKYALYRELPFVRNATLDPMLNVWGEKITKSSPTTLDAIIKAQTTRTETDGRFVAFGHDDELTKWIVDNKAWITSPSKNALDEDAYYDLMAVRGKVLRKILEARMQSVKESDSEFAPKDVQKVVKDATEDANNIAKKIVLERSSKGDRVRKSDINTEAVRESLRSIGVDPSFLADL